MSEIEDVLAEDAQNTRAAVSLGMDDDPEKAARSLKASNTFGVPLSAVEGDDADKYIDSLTGQAAGDLVSNNLHLQNYVQSHRLAATVSNDDWIPLDQLSAALDKAHAEGPSTFNSEDDDPDSYYNRLQATPTAKMGGAVRSSLGKALGVFNEAWKQRNPTEESKQLYDYLLAQHNNPVWNAFVKYGIGEQAFSGIVEFENFMDGALKSGATFIGSLASNIPGVDEEAATREAYQVMTSQAHIPEAAMHIPLEGGVKITPVTPAVEAAKTASSGFKAALPWARAGKEVPAGLHEVIDDAKKIQAEVDEKNLSDAMQAAFASATKERSPELFQQFLENWPDARIEIPVEKIREFYGEEVPAPGDGKLGFIHNLAEKMGDAENWKGDIEIPIRDWYANVEPEVYNALHDDVRVRPHGLTVNEAKELPPTKSTPPEIEDQIRQIAGLDPLLQVVDEKKLTLQKVAEMTEEQRSPLDKVLGRKGLTFHGYDFLNEKGERVGGGIISLTPDGKTLTIQNITGVRGYRATDFGPKLVMDLLRQLRKEFPDVKKLEGYRISGAREEADAAERMVSVDLDKTKFDQDGYPEDWKVIEPFLDTREGPEWAQLTPVVEMEIPRPEDWTPEQHEIASTAMRELERIVGPANFAQLSIVRSIKAEGRTAWGLHQLFRDMAPVIALALDSPHILQTARHEAIHFLRQAGLWTPKEWATLERAARAGKWIEKHRIDNRYAHLPEAGQLEEAIAEEFAQWKAGRKIDIHTSLHPIFVKMKAAFDQLGKTLLKAIGRTPNAADLFLAADIGEIAERPVAPINPEAFRPQAELAEEPEMKQPFLKKPPGMTQDLYNRFMQAIENQRLNEAESKEARLRKQEAKRQTVEWKDNRKDLRKDVADSIGNRPDFLADSFLREGDLFGAKLKPTVKLLRSAVPENYHGVLEKFLGEEGIHPDDLSGLFGYRTGDEMLSRLADLQQKRKDSGLEPKDYQKKVVDAETDRQMEQKYGDLADNIDQAIDDMLTPATIDYIHQETIYYAEKAGQQVPLDPVALAKQIKPAMMKMTLPQINAQKFMETANKAADAADKAATSGKWLDAFKAAQQRKYAVIMAKHARDVEKEVTQFNRLAKTNADRTRASVKQEYTNFIHQILVQVGKGVKRSVQDIQKEIEAGRYATLSDFVAGKRGDGHELEMPEFLYDPNYSTNMKKMTGEEFTQIHEGLQTMVTNGRFERKLQLLRGSEDLDQAKADVLALTADLKRVKIDGIGAGVRKLGRNALASSLQMEDIMERLERGKYGPLTQTIRELIDAVNVKDRMEREAAANLRKLPELKDLNKKLSNALFREPRTVPDGEPGPLMPMTRKNLISVMLNTGNEGNLTKLAKGYDILDNGMVMDWVHTHATEADWKFVQGVWDIFADLKVKADEMYRELSGIAPEDIEIRPVQTKFGEYKGGYYPLIKHEFWEGLKQGEKEPPSGKLGENYVKATVPRGYTKTRTGATYPLSLQLDGMIGRMAQEINDIAVRRAWLEANKLLGSAEIKNEITRKLGPEFKNLIDPFLRDVAGVQNYRSDLQLTAAKWSEFFRQNVITSLVGLNPSTVMKHGTTAAINSLTEVGPINFAKAIKQLFSMDEETGNRMLNFALENSVELQRRHRNYVETLGGSGALTFGEGKFMRVRDVMMKLASTPVMAVDMASAVPTWMAAYEKAIKEVPGDKGRAISFADRSVRRAHGSTAITSRAAIARQGALASWMTSLYGFFSHILNRQWEMTWRAREAAKLVKAKDYNAARKEFQKVGVMFFSYVIAPAVVEEMVSGEGDPEEGWLHKGARVMGRGLASSWVGLRDIASALDYGKDPTLGIMGTGLHQLNNVYRDLRKDEPFNEEHSGKLIQDGATVFGAMFGIANAQEGKVGRYLHDVKVGNVEPEGLGDWRYGLWHGVPRKEE